MSRYQVSFYRTNGPLVIFLLNFRLFFPSKLPDNPPLAIESTPPINLKKVCRLYRMAELPSGFWTRLLSRMMTRVEQFSRNEWFFGTAMKQSVRHPSMRRVQGSYKDIHKGKSLYVLYSYILFRTNANIGLHCSGPMTTTKATIGLPSNTV